MRRPLHQGGLESNAASSGDTIEAIAAITASAFGAEREPNLGTVVICLRGEVDATTATQVCGLLSASVGETAVVLDLTAVTLIDSVGLGVLQEFIRRVFAEGGLVAVARPARGASPVLPLVGTEGFVFLAFSATGALAWFDQHPPLRLVPESDDAALLSLDAAPLSLDAASAAPR